MIQPLKVGFSTHNVRCLIGDSEFIEGNDYQIQIVPMTGRIYKPGKTPDGKEWLDKIGKPDERMMVMAPRLYKVFESMEEVNKCFQE